MVRDRLGDGQWGWPGVVRRRVARALVRQTKQKNAFVMG